MLITSRERRRWVIPKGNPIKGLKPHEAAAFEAFEEAGLKGVTNPAPIGQFRYLKRRTNGADREMRVTVFPLAVLDQAAHWPERDERETRWFDLRDAAEAVEERDLAALIAAFREPAAAGTRRK